MKQRIMNEITLCVLILFTTATMGLFTIGQSYAHDACSSCPADQGMESGNTYCYTCNTPHYGTVDGYNHDKTPEEIAAEANSLISSGNLLIGDINSLITEVNGFVDLMPDDIGNIAEGLLNLGAAIGGVVVTCAGIASAPSGVGAVGVLVGAYVTINRGQAAYDNFKTAFDSIKARNTITSCPGCGNDVSQAELNGTTMVPSIHIFIPCNHSVTDENGFLISCPSESMGNYRACRGECPNAINHYNTNQ